jgi:hypothetical protein
MEKEVLAVRTPGALTGDDFAGLSDVPLEAEWFANLTSPNTRRAYKSDIRSYSLSNRCVADSVWPHLPAAAFGKGISS